MNLRTVFMSAFFTVLTCAVFIGVLALSIWLVEINFSWESFDYSAPISIDSSGSLNPPEAKQDKKITPAVLSVSQPVYFKVWATREGLVGETTASGHLIKAEDKFVALPSRKALRRIVEVRYLDRGIRCPVLDVGPHSIADDYWNKGTRPLSESGKRIPEEWGHTKNKAGADLSDGLWDAFEIPREVGLVEIEWRFVESEK